MATNGGPMTPHADLVARLEELASKNGCLSAAYENCIEQGASQSDMCLTCAAATAAKALAALPPPADPPMVPESPLAHAAVEATARAHGWDAEQDTLAGWLHRRLSRPADPPALVALGERLRTQDNHMTAHPIFVVEHRDDARRPWEFVTACLTDEGAIAYMNANGHNLRKFSRIFVHSGYRNDQWIGLRNHLMALPAAPPVTDTPQGCPTCGGPRPCDRCTTSNVVDLDALKSRLENERAGGQERHQRDDPGPEDNDQPYCPECGAHDERVAYVEQYAESEEWRCKDCEQTFAWRGRR